MSTKQNTKPSVGETVYLSAELILGGIQKCAIALAGERRASDNRLQVWGEWIPKLHSAKIKFGRRNGKNACPNAIAFHDQLVAEGLSVSTANDYLTLFRQCVESGETPEDLNQYRKDKAKAAKTKSKAKDAKDYAEILKAAFQHDGGNSFHALCTAIEHAFNDAVYPTIYEGFKDYMLESGVIEEVKSK